MKLLLLLLLAAAAPAFGWTNCKLKNYVCLPTWTGENAFCLGGQVMHCPRGTRCKTPHLPAHRSPCVSIPVKNTCDHGDFHCTSHNTFCHGGATFKCARGTVCKHKAPCVNKAHNRRCHGGDYKCDGLHGFCHGGEYQQCAPGTFCRGGYAPCVSPNRPVHDVWNDDDWSR